MSAPIAVTDAQFEEMVLKSEVPVVVDFWAPWCGPCRMVGPILDELAKEYGDKIRIAKVNTDEDTEWAMKFGVQGIPNLLFIRDGELKDQVVGAYPKPALQQRIDSLLTKVPQ